MSHMSQDAHNCIPEFDEETAMFSVYDGHGGITLALTCFHNCFLGVYMVIFTLSPAVWHTY